MGVSACQHLDVRRWAFDVRRLLAFLFSVELWPQSPYARAQRFPSKSATSFSYFFVLG